MRYSIVSKDLSPAQIETEAKRVRSHQCYQGETARTGFLRTERRPGESPVPGTRAYGQANPDIKPTRWRRRYRQLRHSRMSSTSSALTLRPLSPGAGLTVAVLDSGIRKSHEALRNKVIYEADFSGSTTPDIRLRTRHPGCLCGCRWNAR